MFPFGKVALAGVCLGCHVVYYIAFLVDLLAALLTTIGSLARVRIASGLSNPVVELLQAYPIAELSPVLIPFTGSSYPDHSNNHWVQNGKLS